MSLLSSQIQRKGKPIEIQTRSLNDSFGQNNEIETFVTVPNGNILAIICTPNGKTVFDGVNIEENVTHEFYLEWPGFDVTVENWVFFTQKNKRYRILNVKNCCEADKTVILQCTERGLTEREASNA